jgi:hypothetical protein
LCGKGRIRGRSAESSLGLKFLLQPHLYLGEFVLFIFLLFVLFLRVSIDLLEPLLRASWLDRLFLVFALPAEHRLAIWNAPLDGFMGD